MEIVSAEEAGRTKKRTKKKSTSKLNVDRAGIEREEALFRALDTAREGFVRREVIIDALKFSGLRLDDPRLEETLRRLDDLDPPNEISLEAFASAIAPSVSLIERALKGRLVIPDFKQFEGEIREIFEETRRFEGGKVADYIPSSDGYPRNVMGWHCVRSMDKDWPSVMLKSVFAFSRPVSQLTIVSRWMNKHRKRFILMWAVSRAVVVSTSLLLITMVGRITR